MSHYRPTELLRADLRTAVEGIELSSREQLILDWLAGWDQDTVGPILTLLDKAQPAPCGHSAPKWTEKYR